MQVLLTAEEYESFHKEIRDLKRIVAVLTYQQGGTSTVYRLHAYDFTYTITPFRNEDSSQKRPDGWHITAKKVKCD